MLLKKLKTRKRIKEEQEQKQIFQSKEHRRKFRLKRDEEQLGEYVKTLAKEVYKLENHLCLWGLKDLQKSRSKNIDWKFELYNAINRHMRNNYAFMPPNKNIYIEDLHFHLLQVILKNSYSCY